MIRTELEIKYFGVEVLRSRFKVGSVAESIIIFGNGINVCCTGDDTAQLKIQRKGSSLMNGSHYPQSGDPIVFFDFETTGLCPTKDSIIEVAAVKYVPGAAEHPHMSYLIKIDRPLPHFIKKLTGISDEMLMTHGRGMDTVIDEFIEFIGDHAVVAFNINFDARFLNAAIERHGRAPIRNVGHCALAGARAAWPELPSHKLVNLAKHLKLETGKSHRALDDTLLALEVYFRALHIDKVTEPVNRAVKRSEKTIDAGTPSITPVINGPRQFRIEVLGTARYQDVFETACGPRTVKGGCARHSDTTARRASIECGSGFVAGRDNRKPLAENGAGLQARNR